MAAERKHRNHMNGVLEDLLGVERSLFFALNGSNSLFLDNLMWTYSTILVWIPLYAFFFFVFFYKVPKTEAILLVVFIVLLLVACDQISSSVFKPLFHRFRPTHHPEFENAVDMVRGYRGGRFGFISSHATNSFGLATFLSFVFRNRWLTLSTLLWALIISYSRIYLGVHFISDVVAGAIAGGIIAFLLYQLYTLCRHRFYHVSSHEMAKTVYSSKHSKLIAVSVIVYIFLILALSPLISSLPL